jgi:hypothetical protein
VAQANATIKPEGRVILPQADVGSEKDFRQRGAALSRATTDQHSRQKKGPTGKVGPERKSDATMIS